MPLYPPRHLAPTKQLETLAKREAKLRSALAENRAPEKVQQALEGVREAQLRVLKARLALLDQTAESTEKQRQVRKISAEEAFWMNASADEIVRRSVTSEGGAR